MDCSLPGSFYLWDFPGKYTGLGCHFQIQGIFPTQASNPCLLCWQAEFFFNHWATREALTWGSVQFSCSVGYDSLRPHGLQHTRPPCPSWPPRACSNSCPLSRWCHPTISSCHPLLLLPSFFPSIRIFSNESVLPIRWPKYWNFSFSISLSNEYSGLISFRIEWFDLLVVQGTLKSLLQNHSSEALIPLTTSFCSTPSSNYVIILHC